jgi:hypothetical protein
MSCRSRSTAERATEIFVVARRSLAGGLVMMAALSCLVTSTPELAPAKASPPYLLVAGASPDPRVPITVADPSQPVVFTASAISDDATASLEVELLIDYGSDRADGLKADNRVGPTPVQPSGSAARPIAMKWFPSITNTPTGCHTVTMMLGHELDFETGCPPRSCDSSQITWFVNLGCSGADCAPCKTPVDSCPADLLVSPSDEAARAALHAAYPCPSDDQDAGGAP